MTPFRFIHFCDFHIGGPRGAQINYLDSLVAQVAQVVADLDGPISAIFLVGDISYSGKPSEFATFTKHFLDPLKAIPRIAQAHIYAVPGNHDVDCDEALPITWAGIQKRNQEIFFNEDEDGIRARKSRAPVFGAYWEFADKNGIRSPNPAKEISILDSDDQRPVDILAVNTAFFSDKGDHSSASITPAPLPSMRRLAKAAATARPLFVLGHHSPSSFLLEHARQLEMFLVDRKAVLLHGHEHMPKVSFNHDGSLRTVGFGASYVSSMETQTYGPYTNSFTVGIVADSLQLSCFSWVPSPGTWSESTAQDFHDCLVIEGGIKKAVVALPRGVIAGATTQHSQPITHILRATAKPSNIIPLNDGNSIGVWTPLFATSDNLKGLFRREIGPKISEPNEKDGKRSLVLTAEDGRHLVVIEQAMNHILSAKELESFNTRLDTEGFTSLTVLSFGKISEEAKLMYVRLRQRKPIEVLVNYNFTAEADAILSPPQRAVLSNLEGSTNAVSVVAGDSEVFVLVINSTATKRYFYVIRPDGKHLIPSDDVVKKLRACNAELERMDYIGATHGFPSENLPLFDESQYKLACHKEYNVVRYSALASLGIRFSDFSLEELYVTAKASEVDTSGGNRLEDLVDDYLAAYAVSDELRRQIQRQILSNFTEPHTGESSAAREFCQKYAAVLLTGDPGSGKTCFVKNEILAYCKCRTAPTETNTSETVSDWHAAHTPILIQLSELVGESDVDKAGVYTLSSRLLSRRGFYFPAADIERLSKEGRIAWFFDGLDEVVSVEKRATVVELINQLVNGTIHLGNRLVVTSRPAAVHVVNLLPSLRKLEVQGLSEPEIRTLAARVLRLRLASTGDKVVVHNSDAGSNENQLIDRLMSDCRQNPGVARLAQNPLLLTLLIMIYANSGAPSAKRHIIYAQAVETLAEVRGREAGHAPISTQDLRERLGAVALSVYRKQSGLLPTRQEVCEVVRIVMERQRGGAASVAEADAFVQRVAESTGLVAVENKVHHSDYSSLVTFMHHSFLEYFAAVGLSRELDELDLAELVSQPRWHEILTILAGIIGESEDVAPILKRIVDASRDSGDVDAKLLLFAMDCALECDVPSEAAQELICNRIRECICSGPARLDPWVRSEIGHRAAQLFTICGGTQFDAMLRKILEHGSAEECAPAISILGYCVSSGYKSDTLVESFNVCCGRSEEDVLCAVIVACGKARALRTDKALKVLVEGLRKSSRRRQAAFEALGAIPSLAADHWSDVINGMDDTNKRTARLASIAAIQGGLNADVVTLSGSKKDVLIKALRTFDESGITDGRAFHVKRDTAEHMVNSIARVDRLIGIQVLPLSDADPQFIYETLLTILRAGVDRQEVSAALIALRQNSEVLAILNQSDLRTIISFLGGATGDVRHAAVKLLGNYGGEFLAVEALLSIDYTDLLADEYANAIFSLSHASVLTGKVTAFLYECLDELTAERAKWTDDNAIRLRAVLGGLKRMRATGPSNLIMRIRSLAEDALKDTEIRKSAMLCYPAVAIPSDGVVMQIAAWFQSPPVGLELELVQVPSILAARCRESVDYVAAAIKALISLKAELIAFHAKIRRRAISENTEFFASELRKGIGDVGEIVVTFQELMDVNNARSPQLTTAATGQ